MTTNPLYPAAFLERMKHLPGNEYDDFIVSLAGTSPTAFRLNPEKIVPAVHGNALIPWCEAGRYLEVRPVFTLDPLFQAGGYYVQEASSMFLEQAIKQTVDLAENLKVLDLCAAPGGKTTHVCSLISQDSLLISNEVIKGRVKPLEENIIKWGNANVFITNNDPKDFQKLKNYFDVIILDAPCSGEGLFRKDPKAVSEWSENNVAICSARQKRILSDIAGSLKPGGVLIYSTCTYSFEENEENMQWFMSHNDFISEKLQIDEAWKITETKTQAGEKYIYSYRFYPHKTKGEGFFISCLRKKEIQENERDHQKHKYKQLELLPKKQQEAVKKWVAKPELFEWLVINDQVMAIKKEQVEALQLLKESLYLKHAGINMGKIINKELIPSHELALSNAISGELPFLELNLEQSLAYLRKQDLKLDTAGKQGWVLVKYEGLNLGWIKVLTNRINNYFPKEWRIRM